MLNYLLVNLNNLDECLDPLHLNARKLRPIRTVGQAPPYMTPWLVHDVSFYFLRLVSPEICNL